MELIILNIPLNQLKMLTRAGGITDRPTLQAKNSSYVTSIDYPNLENPAPPGPRSVFL